MKSAPEVSHCTIAGNYARDWGGGINIYMSDAEISNCIVWGNSAPSYPQIYYSWPGSLTVAYSDVEGGRLGVGNIDADPCFAEAGYWDPNGTPADESDDFWVEGNYHLRPESHCIDAGSFCYFMNPPCTDYDGNTRVAGNQIDMSCYETNSLPDTDGDWLADSCEPNEYVQNPDRDGDMILDGIEILGGTDPNFADPPRDHPIPVRH